MDNESVKSNKEYFHKNDLKEIFGYGRDKTVRLLESGILPVVKINDDYIISREELNRWFKQNAGKKIII